MKGFRHDEIEKHAQEKWERLELNRSNLTDDTREPYYLLFEFPYPSGDLHIGHWYAFALTDIYARFLRQTGKNVLFPVGFDAFGLPAENAAIKHGVNPREWTYKNMEHMRTQMKSMGTSVDWSREVITCDPSYYKWTQWLFIKLMEQGLAERKEASVKWCPKDNTVLANEQVVDGACERCGTEVEEKRLTQWFMKITDYAERLLSDLDPLPWREDIKEAQRAWIGKSEGAALTFSIQNSDEFITVFTTRPDTVFGATYVVLAPEHKLVDVLKDSITNWSKVEAYRTQTSRKTDRERSENKEKTGVELKGVSAINPGTKEAIPVYLADYVLGSYGTGAVMAVPAHDERDYEFAKRMSLPVTHVVLPVRIDEKNPQIPGKEVVFRNLVMAIVRNPRNDTYLVLRVKSPEWTTFVIGGVEDGEDIETAARREILEESGYKNLKFIRTLGGPIQSEFYAGHKGVNRVAHNTTVLFELLDEAQEPLSEEEADKHTVDWVPFSEITREKMSHAELDIVLARLEQGDGAYTGEGVLVNSGPFNGRNNEEAMWDIVESVDGTRTTNYRIRDWLVSRQRYWGCPIPVAYDPEGKPHPIPSEHLPWLLPEDVDFALGGADSPLKTSKELKARVEAIFGEGWTPEYDTLDTFVDSSWYFYRYLTPTDEHHFSDSALMKKWLPVDRYSGGSEHTTMHLLYARFFHKALHDLALVPGEEPFVERFNRGLILGPDGQKMSKSKGNVVNPDECVKEFGADAIRAYLAFIGPYNESGTYPWNLDGVKSMRTFLERVQKLKDKVVECPGSLARPIARTAQGVSEDTTKFKYNTALAKLMTLVREFEKAPAITLAEYHDLLTLLAPYAPHLSEHLYGEGQEYESIHLRPFPVVDGALLEEDTETLTVQVLGKKRAELTVPKGSDEAFVVGEAKKLPEVSKYLDGKEINRVIYVSGRILNFVVS
ncbi:MAG: class I tRNA ligase family protein [Candidatus Pacebacteria bacterium]|nr:class I tRNA ligase family protein [Candidatus Paceibacterota bacterium]